MQKTSSKNITVSNDTYLLLQNTILNQEPSIEPHLHQPPQGSLTDRIAIYANGFHSRFKKVLASDYKMIATLMGDNDFSQLCHQYIMVYPSSHYSLYFLGQHLSQFLADTPPYNKVPYLAEIAAYEWAELEAFTATDKPALMANELQSVAVDKWPSMKLYLHPSCHLLRMNWNTCLLVNALRSKHLDTLLPKKLDYPESIMIWRYQRQVSYCVLNDLECLIINAIKNNLSFLNICEHINSFIPDQDVVSYLMQTLYNWIQKEWFIRVYNTIKQ